MKRYSIDGSCECGRYEDDRLYDDAEGEYVLYDDAAAEIEKLKCCGNCEHVRLYARDVRCELDHEEVYIDQKCKFDHSRWQCFETLDSSECLD